MNIYYFLIKMKHISRRLIGRPVCVCAHPPKDLQSESKI